MTTRRIFVGYYHVTAAGVQGIITRPAVTVPKTKPVGKNQTIFTAAQMNATLVNLVDTNELFPIEDLNSLITDGFFTTLFTELIADATTTGGRNSVKIGMSLPDSGDLKDTPSITVVKKVNGVKSSAIVAAGIPAEVIAAVGAPDAFTAAAWSVASSVSGSVGVTLSALPSNGGSAIDGVTAFVYSDGTSTTSIAQLSLPAFELATNYELTLDTETFTDGVTYYVELIASNANDDSAVSDRKSFVASMQIG